PNSRATFGSREPGSSDIGRPECSRARGHFPVAGRAWGLAPPCRRRVMGSKPPSGRAMCTGIHEATRRPKNFRPVGLLATILAVATASLGARAAGAEAADRSDTSLSCVEAWGESRYRNYGYDHVVHLRNRCEKAALCAVSTSVNPDPARVTLAPKEETEVLT